MARRSFSAHHRSQMKRTGVGASNMRAVRHLDKVPDERSDIVSAGAEKLLSSVEAEISRLVEQKTPNAPTQIEAEAERIKAAIARLTSNSIDGLEGLMSELQ